MVSRKFGLYILICYIFWFVCSVIQYFVGSRSKNISRNSYLLSWKIRNQKKQWLLYFITLIKSVKYVVLTCVVSCSGGTTGYFPSWVYTVLISSGSNTWTITFPPIFSLTTPFLWKYMLTNTTFQFCHIKLC